MLISRVVFKMKGQGEDQCCHCATIFKKTYVHKNMVNQKGDRVEYVHLSWCEYRLWKRMQGIGHNNYHQEGDLAAETWKSEVFLELCPKYITTLLA